MVDYSGLFVGIVAIFTCVYPLIVAAFRAVTCECTVGEMCTPRPRALGFAAAYGLQLAWTAGSVIPPSSLLPSGLALCVYTYYNFVRGPAARGADMSGKVCMVTGANTGIGFETARALAALGASVVLACRSTEKAQAAMARILVAEPKVKAAQLDMAVLDLSSLRSIRACASVGNRFFYKRHGRLDVLVLNAGVMSPSREVTEDGVELTLAANHLGHFALTRLLLPLLEAGDGGRVVVVSSALHRKAAKLDLPSFTCEVGTAGPPTFGHGMFPVYIQSKLANVLFADELQRRLAARGAKVTANSLHPGNVHTEVTRSFHPLVRAGYTLARPLMSLFEKAPAAGASTSVHLAAAPELAGQGGGYYVHCAPVAKGAAAVPADAQALWERSDQLLAAAAERWPAGEGWPDGFFTHMKAKAKSS